MWVGILLTNDLAIGTPLMQRAHFTINITDVQQEKEDSKRRCDWAFTERDKIVRERESIRTLCDKLRHERDGAVSKLIEALRDTDELKKQKSDALKQLKEVKSVLFSHK